MPYYIELRCISGLYAGQYPDFYAYSFKFSIYREILLNFSVKLI